MSTIYTALITGAPDALADLDLMVAKLQVDLTATQGTVEVESMRESDYDGALLRPNGAMKVFESIDGEALVEIVSVAMLATNKQEKAKRASVSGEGASVSVRVTLRAQGSITVTPVTDEPVDQSFGIVQGGNAVQRIRFGRVVEPTSSVLANGKRTEVDQSTVYVSNARVGAVQTIRWNGAP